MPEYHHGMPSNIDLIQLSSIPALVLGHVCPFRRNRLVHHQEVGQAVLLLVVDGQMALAVLPGADLDL